MHRAQRIERKKPNAAPKIIDNRQPKVVPPPPSVDPAVANIPLRTVFLMEVGDMETAKVQLLVQEVNAVYRDNRGGPHYVLAIRHGKIGSDLVFEDEWLAVVRDTCEFDRESNQIVLKEGAQQCRVVRTMI